MYIYFNPLILAYQSLSVGIKWIEKDGIAVFIFFIFPSTFQSQPKSSSEVNCQDKELMLQKMREPKCCEI